MINLKIRNQRIKRNYSRIVINNNKDKDKSNQKFGPINIVNKELIMKQRIFTLVIALSLLATMPAWGQTTVNDKK
jgi:hypothetical protein